MLDGTRLEITPLWSRLIADAVVAIHLGFILFVVFGAILVIKWHKLIFFPCPFRDMGLVGRISGLDMSPSPPFENWFRRGAGSGGYQNSFIDQYLLPLLYPPGLNREWQIVLGTLVILVNVGMYVWVWLVWNQKQSGENS